MELSNSVAISAPATTANLGPGFDTLGAALEIRNEVIFYPERTFSIKIFGEGSSSLPRSRENLVVKAYEESFREEGTKPVEGAFIIKNRIPLSRGLGSSAAASVLGSYLAALVMGKEKEEIENLVLRVATRLEGHPDNVVPCLYGGIQICVQNGSSVKNFPVRLPRELNLVLVVPRKKISTPKARKILGKKISLEQAVFNIQRVCLLVWALENERTELLEIAMQDEIHQNKRLKLVEGAADVFHGVSKHPRCVCSWLSGSGSAMAFAVKKDYEKELEQHALKVCQKLRFEARVISTKFSEKGTGPVVTRG